METLGHPTFVIALRFKNIVAFEPDCSVVGDNAQEQTTAFLNSFAQLFFPVFSRLKLLFVKPDKATVFLELADDVARDFQVRRSIADENAAETPVFFTMCLVHKIRVAHERLIFITPAEMQFGDEVNRVDWEDPDLFSEPAEVDDNFLALRGIKSFENEEFAARAFFTPWSKRVRET